MAKLGAEASAGISASREKGGGYGDLFNLKTPAGWAMFWWFLSVTIILVMMMSL